MGGAHALLWSGSAESYVDLNPDGFDWSIAGGVSGSQQVGWGEGPATGGTWHALLWGGDGANYVDLNPPEYQRSKALDTNGTQQVGVGLASLDGRAHALLWTGTASSAVDLHECLPSEFISSQAWAIDNHGNIVGTAHPSSGSSHAILWKVVPEPATVTVWAGLLGIGLMGHWRRRRGAA